MSSCVGKQPADFSSNSSICILLGQVWGSRTTVASYDVIRCSFCESAFAWPHAHLPRVHIFTQHAQYSLLTIGLHARAGKFGTSAAVGQVLPPKPQMVAKQDWSYVSGGGRSIYGAHADQLEITSLAFTRDSTTMLSRGADATLKVRMLATP